MEVKKTWRPKCFGTFRDYHKECAACPFRYTCDDEAQFRRERMESKYGRDC